MSNKKSIVKLTSQFLVVFGAIVVMMHFMGLLDTFGVFGFFVTALIMAVVITVIFL